jgi:hypothetical protein
MVRVSFQLLCVASPSGSGWDCRNNCVLGWSAVHADFYGNGTAKVPNIFAATDNRQKPVHAAKRQTQVSNLNFRELRAAITGETVRESIETLDQTALPSILVLGKPQAQGGYPKRSRP